MKRLAAHMAFGGIVAIVSIAAVIFKPIAILIGWLLEWAEQSVEKDIDGHRS